MGWPWRSRPASPVASNDDRPVRIQAGVMLAADVRHWDRVARANFIQVTDGVLDTWRSHAGAALNGNFWYGDRGDLVVSVLDLVGRRGVAQEHRFVLLVDTIGTGVVDHVVGCVLSKDRRFMIVGDSLAPAYGAKSMAYTTVLRHRLGERDEGRRPLWRKGPPWA